MGAGTPGSKQTPIAFFPLSFSFPCQLRKPLIERKRRERINNCLDQLKETVVGAFHLDVSAHFYSKLEKADILEMTVKHLQNIQSSKLMGECLVPHPASAGESIFQTRRGPPCCSGWVSPLDGEMELAALRSLSPSQQPLLTPKGPLSPKGSTRGTNPPQERFYAVENKQASKNSFQLPSLSAFSQADAAPPRQVLQPNFSHNNPRMGALDMWRPW
uniref:BHLH domain-containing protein n=1 Tax=Amazona collaria TaxID=241587 RepID=A0A8B9EZ44_9PSIT